MEFARLISIEKDDNGCLVGFLNSKCYDNINYIKVLGREPGIRGVASIRGSISGGSRGVGVAAAAQADLYQQAC